MKESLENTVFPEPILAFIRKLRQHDVPFLVIGAFAMGAHGFIRGTLDVDLWISDATQHIQALGFVLLEEGGDPSIHNEIMESLHKNNFIQTTIPTEEKIYGLDIIIQIKKMQFDEVYARRLDLELDGETISFIGLEDLLQSKLIARRHKDIPDIQNLRIAIEARRRQQGGGQGSL